MNTIRFLLLVALLGTVSCSGANLPLVRSPHPWPDRPPADETPCQGPVHVC
jgi:hypothetical protein